MICELNEEMLDSLYLLGSELHIKFNTLYDYKSLNEDINETYCFIDNNNLKGFVHIQNICGEINIIDIIVDKNSRNNGIGTLLIDYLLKKYKVFKFVLEVNEDNINAIKFYKSHGFKEVGTRKNYYDDKDAIIMER